jgi:hypothetical protein
MEALDMLSEENCYYCSAGPLIGIKSPKLSKEEALIHWQLSSDQIFNKIRAFKLSPDFFDVRW